MTWLQGMMKYHPAMMGAFAMAVLNCAVTTLPTPAPNGSALYEWVFNFAHALVLALPRIASQYKSDQKP